MASSRAGPVGLTTLADDTQTPCLRLKFKAGLSYPKDTAAGAGAKGVPWG